MAEWARLNVARRPKKFLSTFRLPVNSLSRGEGSHERLKRSDLAGACGVISA
jgi:hypothetical protein